jgi:CubicO group peptidase (beta-lactamase class C family)
MNVNHRLRIGSVSKTITSTTIFRLIQSGATYGSGKKLTLDSPIMGPDGILPDLKAPPQLPQFASAKLHHILEHTAGLPGNLSNEEVGDPTNCSAGNLVQRINDVIAKVKPIPAPPPGSPANGGPIPRAPGIMFDYSNIDFAIAQAVIERVKPGPYAATVMQQVFTPAGLTQPALFHTGPYDASLGEAKQYSPDGSYAQYSTCDNLPPNVGAGGWDMSAKDLLRYLLAEDSLTSPPDILNANERTECCTARLWTLPRTSCSTPDMRAAGRLAGGAPATWDGTSCKVTTAALRAAFPTCTISRRADSASS